MGKLNDLTRTVGHEMKHIMSCEIAKYNMIRDKIMVMYV